MGLVGWVASTEGEVTLAAATAKTVLNVIAPTNTGVTLCTFKVDFDGVTAAAEPVLVELCRSTQATAGTNTSVTPRRKRGPSTLSASGTAAKNYTVEPTVITLIEDYAVDPYKGMFAIQYPLGREAQEVGGGGLLLRLNAPAAVNVRAFIEYEIG
jgi:hypothetical protein